MRCSQLAVSSLLALLAAQPFLFAQETTWNGSEGDWFDVANWSDGLPDATKSAVINQGEARFEAPVTVGGDDGFLLGSIFTLPSANETLGVARGSADLEVIGPVWIGRSAGGHGFSSRRDEGQLRLSGGDLTTVGSALGQSPDIYVGFTLGLARSGVAYDGVGHAELIDGSIRSAGEVSVGLQRSQSLGGGITAVGQARLTRGDLVAVGRVRIGYSDIVRGSDTVAEGQVRITSGDLRVAPRINPDTGAVLSLLSIGVALGDFFSGQRSASGELLVEAGDVVADIIEVGAVRSIFTEINATGRMKVRGGDIRMQSLQVGELLIGGDAVQGVVELADGTVQGDQLLVYPFGDLVLDIGGEPEETTEALSQETPYGKVRVDDVQIDGGLTARFLEGFQPEPGQQFDLIVAEQLAGDFSLEVVGLDPEWLDQMTVVQTPTLLRLQFAVPEPTAAVLAAITLLGVAARR